MPLTFNSIEDLIRITRLDKNMLFPEEGHICAALSDDNANITDDLSFRPRKDAQPILRTESAMHSRIYGSTSNPIRLPFFEIFHN